MTDEGSDEFRALQDSYLVDVREKIDLFRLHGDALKQKKGFKGAFPVLLYLSHQLKGSGGSLGFPRISEIAQLMRNELNGFLDDIEPRPTPVELAERVHILTTDLEQAIGDAEKQVTGTERAGSNEP